MSKSVGGFIQLIAPIGENTWEEYKKKYGIDLDEYFEILNDGVHFRFGINKPILISGYEESAGTRYGYLPNCGFLSKVEPEANGVYINLYFGSGDYAWGVQVTNNRKISPVEL